MNVDVDTLQLFRTAGLAGFGVYVGVYALVGWRILSGDSLLFFAGNTLAASLVLLSNLGEFNLASVLCQIFFIVIGTSAMMIRVRERPPSAPR